MQARNKKGSCGRVKQVVKSRDSTILVEARGWLQELQAGRLEEILGYCLETTAGKAAAQDVIVGSWSFTPIREDQKTALG